MDKNIQSKIQSYLSLDASEQEIKEFYWHLYYLGKALFLYEKQLADEKA